MYHANGGYTLSNFEKEKIRQEQRELAEKDRIRRDNLRHLKTLILEGRFQLLTIPTMSRAAYFVKVPNRAEIYEYDPLTREFERVPYAGDNFVLVRDIVQYLG